VLIIRFPKQSLADNANYECYLAIMSPFFTILCNHQKKEKERKFLKGDIDT